MNTAINTERIKAVNQALCNLGQDFVFVGGAVVALYADRSADEVRETEDVDVLVEIYNRHGYAEMDERLRAIGFALDTSAAFVGRYTISNLVVDFMPMEESVLGFTNHWYRAGFGNAQSIMLDEHNNVKIFTAPYFIAAKLEAFKGRGKNSMGEYDGRFSTDFEDIVFLLVYRSAVWYEMEQSPAALKQYLKTAFTGLLAQPYFEEWVSSHTGFRSAAAQAIVLPGLKRFVNGS